MNPEILLIVSHRNVSQHSAARKQGEPTTVGPIQGRPNNTLHVCPLPSRKNSSSPSQPAGTDVAPATKRNPPPPKRQDARQTGQSPAKGLPARLARVTDRPLAGQRRHRDGHFTGSLLEANDKLGVRPAAAETKQHRAAHLAQVAGLVPACGPAAVGIPI